MSVGSHGSESREQRLDEIIADYLRRKHAGQAPDETTLLAEHPEYAAELKEFLENEAHVVRLVRPSNEEGPAPRVGDKTVDYADVASSLASTVAFKADVPVFGDGRYRVKDFHDGGGMGEIWLAEDVRIGREVAVKSLRGEQADKQDRFQMEAQITGQLEHPGVVRVYDLDVAADGKNYYVMQFVRGKTLKQAISDYFGTHREETKTTTVDQREASEVEFHRLLEVFLDLCQTVAYAHSRGVLHRDLKPENVMLGAFGETLVLDWGLSKAKSQPDDINAAPYVQTNTSGSTETRAGSVMGSPPYLSPEAASGRIDEIDEQSDIFLLGATLYEILTNRPPHQGLSIHEMVELARNAQPPAPRSLNKAIPRPLEAICLKAMGHSKPARYTSAMALALDVRRFMAGEPVSAYRETLVERLVRWLRRHRRAIGYVATATIFFSIVIVSLAKWHEAEQRARLLQSYDQAERQIAQFRERAGDVHFLVAGTDPPSENVPYYSPRRRLSSRIGAGHRRALGTGLAALDPGAGEEQRAAIIETGAVRVVVAACSNQLASVPGSRNSRRSCRAAGSSGPVAGA